jgi:hypothetical protein
MSTFTSKHYKHKIILWRYLIIFFVVILISPLFLGWALGLVFKNESILLSVWNYPLMAFVYGYQSKINKPLGKPPTG